MSAVLDRGTHYGEYTGGVSDPRLVHQVGPVPPVTDQQIAAARNVIGRSFPTDSPEDVTARTEIEAMLFGPTNYRTATALTQPVSMKAAREARWPKKGLAA